MDVFMKEVTTTDLQHLKNTQPVFSRIITRQHCTQHRQNCSDTAKGLTHLCSFEHPSMPHLSRAPLTATLMHVITQSQAATATVLESTCSQLVPLLTCPDYGSHQSTKKKKDGNYITRVFLFKGHIWVNNLFKLRE